MQTWVAHAYTPSRKCISVPAAYMGECPLQDGAKHCRIAVDDTKHCSRGNAVAASAQAAEKHAQAGRGKLQPETHLSSSCSRAETKKCTA